MFEKVAYAATGGQPAEPGLMSMLFPFFLIFAIMYLLILRPQQKQRQQLQQMIEGLKKGDKIVTVGGIIGIITSMQDDYVVIRTGDNDQTKMEILKSSIQGVRK